MLCSQPTWRMQNNVYSVLYSDRNPSVCYHSPTIKMSVVALFVQWTGLMIVSINKPVCTTLETIFKLFIWIQWSIFIRIWKFSGTPRINATVRETFCWDESLTFEPWTVIRNTCEKFCGTRLDREKNRDGCRVTLSDPVSATIAKSENHAFKITLNKRIKVYPRIESKPRIMRVFLLLI